MQLSFFIYYKLNTDRIAIHATNTNIVFDFIIGATLDTSPLASAFTEQ